ncbi:MAG: flagellar FlbD family protein [Anaeromyxobacteraceae bacterium]
MIPVTRLDGKELWVNSEHILFVEATPDTVLTLQGGLHLMVKETCEVVVERTVAYKRRCFAGPERKGPGDVVPFPRPAPPAPGPATPPEE